jgi:excisionase family DNA binding protein
MADGRRTRPLERLTHTIPETAQVLGLSRHTGERLIRAGDLPAMRVARRVLVSKAALAHWLDANSASRLLQQHEAS